MKDRFKMLIFDLDGTLIDTSSSVEYAFIEVFEDALKCGAMDKIPSHEVIMSTFGMLDDDIWNLLAPSMPVALKTSYRQLHDELIGKSLLRTSCVLPGVADMLNRLRFDYTLATASNCGLSYLETVLDNSGIRSFFTYPLCAESVHATEKADILRELIRLADHNEVLMIGDRSTDVEAAKAVGIPVVGVPSKFGKPHELAQADMVLNNILELETLLKEGFITRFI